MTYLMRAAYAGASDLRMRIPELKALRDRSVAVFGLGCLGAPSALEFARAGIKRVSIVDHDAVEAGTIVRWPFGLEAVGRAKCEVLAGFITANYPFTAVRQIPLRVGGVREGPEGKPERELLEEALRGIDLIYDATAELGVQHFLADRARELNVAYVAVSGTPGGWGGRVVRLAGANGPCWNCIQTAMDEPGAPSPPSGPDAAPQGRGCGDPTFEAAGFDMAQIAMLGVRVAVGELCRDVEGGYPAIPENVLVVELRGDDGCAILPSVKGRIIDRHEECDGCRAFAHRPVVGGAL